MVPLGDFVGPPTGLQKDLYGIIATPLDALMGLLWVPNFLASVFHGIIVPCEIL